MYLKVLKNLLFPQARLLYSHCPHPTMQITATKEASQSLWVHHQHSDPPIYTHTVMGPGKFLPYFSLLQDPPPHLFVSCLDVSYICT